MKRNTAAAFVVALVLLFSHAVYAEPITAGSMVYTSSQPSFNILVSGDRFRFDGGFRLAERLWLPNENCRLLGLCHPGESLNFGGAFDGAPEIAGTFTLDGRTFPITGGIANDRLNLHVGFSATLVPPVDVSPGPVTATAPFSFTGSFLYFDSFANDAPNPQIAFTGNGTLTAIFDYRNFEFPGQNQLFLRSATYDFAQPAATPEPATVLLLATGLAGVVRARRSRLKGTGSLTNSR